MAEHVVHQHRSQDDAGDAGRRQRSFRQRHRRRDKYLESTLAIELDAHSKDYREKRDYHDNANLKVSAIDEQLRGRIPR